ncbi:hypothetical protein J0H58_29520 [bacterium]|nr:hypothetical protein [bacterium]
MAVRIQLRRGTAAEWTSADPTLAEGEVGIELDTLKLKVGDGSTAWSALPYVTTGGGGGAVDSVNGQTGTVLLNAGDVGADPSGTAAAAVNAHAAAANPHPQYLTAAEGNAVYAAVSHTHTANQISDATAAGQALLTAVDAAAQRTALGVPAGSGTSTGANTGDQDLSGYATTAAVAAGYQPLDADLTALAALTGTATIYYRSGANTWSAVTIGSGLSFTGGTLAASGGSGGGCLFAQTADVTVTNTIVETTLTGAGVGSLTLPAGFLTAGKTIRIKARGSISTQSGGANAGHKVKLGSTAVWTVAGPFYNTSAVKWAWEAEWVVTCRTTGVSGTVMAQGSVFRAGTVGGGAPQMMTVVNTGTATVDTTASQTIDLTTTWATTGADNSVTCTCLTVEVLN